MAPAAFKCDTRDMKETLASNTRMSVAGITDLGMSQMTNQNQGFQRVEY